LRSLDRVPLDLIFQAPQNDEEIPEAQKKLQEAQKKLQESSERLAGALRTSKNFKPAAEINDDSMKEAIRTGSMSPSRQGTDFGECVARILKWQEDRGDSFPGKLRTFLTKLWPVANFALGFVSFGADVRLFVTF
jgi:hypothetical protein